MTMYSSNIDNERGDESVLISEVTILEVTVHVQAAKGVLTHWCPN